MLLLFLVSITPKQLFHDAITGHKHSYSKFDGALNVHSPKNNFQCNWHNDVIESPFADEPVLEIDYPLPVHSSYIAFNNCSYHSFEHFFSPLRGPPSFL